MPLNELKPEIDETKYLGHAQSRDRFIPGADLGVVRSNHLN